MFYTYRQNNSGGSWHEPAITVIVEANSPDEANTQAVLNGVYFNGVTAGSDCECCGDRWWAKWSDDDGEQAPSFEGEAIKLDEASSTDKYGINWGREADLPNFLIIYKDGTRKEIK